VSLINWGIKLTKLFNVRAREAEDNKPETHSSKDKYKFLYIHRLLQKYKRKYA
jgi:hypothetical protein